MAKTNWAKDKLSIEYLIDSGLLFEINRTILHLFGIALVVKSDEKGVKRFDFKDCRSEPETLLFDKNTIEAGALKLRRFLEEFGWSQDERRCRKLGWGCQYVPQRSDK